MREVFPPRTISTLSVGANMRKHPCFRVARVMLKGNRQLNNGEFKGGGIMESMNQDPLSDPPQSRPHSLRGVSLEPGFEDRLLHWLRRFLASNPFYLLSAALLLYGMYLISADANFSLD